MSGTKAKPDAMPAVRYTINRQLVIITSKMPVLDWIRRVDPAPPPLTLEDLRQSPDVFLIPDDKCESVEDVEKWIGSHWKLLFEHCLNDWYTDESWWPQKRTVSMFKEWFDIQFQPMVWDLAAKHPLRHEDWDEGVGNL